MKMLHIDTGPNWRGGQRQCALLCRNLAGAGHEVHLVCRRGGPLGEALVSDGVRLHALPASGEISPLAVLRLARLLRRLRPALIAAHEAHGLGLAVLARALARARPPIVYHRRVDAPIGSGLASRWKLRAPALVLCVSRAVAAVVEAGGVERARIRVVRDGVPARERVPGAAESVRAELGIGSAGPLLGTIGSLVRPKDHATLLDAFARVAPRFPDAHLILVGSGYLRERLEAQTRSLDLTRRTLFLGERRDTDRLLSALDLFVLSSRTEGLGSTILDAFCLGVPVVASAAGGIPDLVEDGRTGRLAPPEDARALAEAIGRALAEPDASRAMAAAARARFLAELTDRAMAERTIACYREVAAD
jgi:glycosyltransferase involved in cell wall biosynthesis